jgi:hypothetical protein
MPVPCLSPDVYGGALFGILLDLAEHLARHRCGVSFAEQDVAQQVRQWVALGPFEAPSEPAA